MGRRVALLAAVVAALVPAAPAAAAGPTLRSGALEANVTAEPFALELRDRGDGDVLRTLGGPLPSPTDRRARYGPLGYSMDLRVPVLNNAYFGYYGAAEAETVWFHGRRLRASRTEGRSLVLDVETNDPLGHRLEVTLSPTAEGAITVRSRILPGSGPFADRASVSGAAFQGAKAERYLGFGERSNAVDQTGNAVPSWAEEGPYGAGDYEDEVRTALPDYTVPTGQTATNFPIPWLVSTRGLGFLVDQTERSTFQLLSERPDAWQAQAETSFFRFTVFAGPKPAQVVRRYSSYAGRQPDPRGWFFGPWYQPTGEAKPLELARRFRDDDVPVTVAQTYTHYLPCGIHRGKEAQERAKTRAYHELGYRITTYFNPHICTSYRDEYDPAAQQGLLVKDRTGRPYTLSNPFTADQVISEIDFTHPGGKALFGRLLDEAIRDGYDGWMEDFGEYTPTDSVFHDGRGGLEMHNLYPVLYHGASTEHTTKRGGNFAVFIRSGYHGVQRHARIVWGGDPTEDWSCSDGLCAAVHQALSTGLSGVAYWGSDIGGFHSIGNPRTSDELNIRWLQFGAVSGVMRTQANGYSFRNDRARRSQVWSPKVLPVWRRYAKLRTQLYPYIAAASERYQRDGMPITRHLSLVFPDDPKAAAQQREFMFGDDLLVAPVVREGERRRSLYLPRGNWVDLWRSGGWDTKRGVPRLGRAKVLAGGRETSVPAPLDEMPMFVRTGSVIGLLRSDVDTLADVGKGRGLVRMRDRRRRLRLLAFPRGRSTRTVAPGVRVRSREARSGWSLAFRARGRHQVRVDAALSTLRRPFRPCAVRIGKRTLRRKAWRYDRRTRVLHLRFRASRATIRARRCR